MDDPRANSLLARKAYVLEGGAMRLERIGETTLYLGDCLEILPTLGKVDAVVTDPPYGVDFKGKAWKGRNGKEGKKPGGGYINGDVNIGPIAFAEAIKIAARGLVFPGARLLPKYPAPNDIGFVYNASGTGMGKWGWINGHPMLFYGKATKHGLRTPNGFQSNERADINGHPCPKPLGWMIWAVAKASNEGEIVLDPFMGSGTTGVACANLGRKFIGIEIEPKYFDIACRRIEDAYKQPRLFEDPKPEPKQEELCDW